MIDALAKGLWVTFKHIFKPEFTYQYPEKRPVFQPRYRGIHFLVVDDDGLERCVGCELCAIACPADAIYVEAAENTPQARFSPGERYGKVYMIHEFRCIFCGYCEEACPEDAIFLGHDFELAPYVREGFIYGKEKLNRNVREAAKMRPEVLNRLQETHGIYHK